MVNQKIKYDIIKNLQAETEMKQYTVIWREYVETGIDFYETIAKTWVETDKLDKVKDMYPNYIWILPGIQCDIDEKYESKNVIKLI